MLPGAPAGVRRGLARAREGKGGDKFKSDCWPASGRVMDSCARAPRRQRAMDGRKSGARESNLRGTGRSLTRAAGRHVCSSSLRPHTSHRSPRRQPDAEAKTLSRPGTLRSWGKAKGLSHQGCVRLMHWPGWPGCVATRPGAHGDGGQEQLVCSGRRDTPSRRWCAL